MDQVDERDRQAYIELQEKLIEQSSKRKQVRFAPMQPAAILRVHSNLSCPIPSQVALQLRTRDTEQKRAVLTAEELGNLPDDAKTYEQIGRA